MNKKNSTIYGFFFILLCLNSLIYFNPENLRNQGIKPLIGDDHSETDEGDTDYESYEYPSSILDTPMNNIETPGSFQTKAYFHYDTELNIDSDGLGFELEEYENMKDDGANCIFVRPRFDSTGSSEREHTFPPDTTNYYEFTSPYSPYEKSHLFTPIFEEETYIKGNVHFMTHITNQWDTATPTIDFKISLFLFNPATSASSFIQSIEDIGIDYEFWSSPQRNYTMSLPSTYTIPAGYRLKIKLEGKISTLDETGEFKIFFADDDAGNVYSWQIDDYEYSSTYSITDINKIFGVQFYMNNDYPDINVAGFTNDTKYFDRKNITMTVSGAISSAYKWDGGSYTSFNDSEWSWSPDFHGWH